MQKENISFDDFCIRLLDKLTVIHEMEGNPGNIVITSVVKGNDHERKAVTIEGWKRSISPLVYVDALYDKCGNIDEIAANTYNMLKSSEQAIEESDVQGFLTPEGVKKGLTFRLINKRMNKKYLEDKMFRDYLDLAVIYQISLRNDVGRVIVTKDLAERLGYTEEDLFEMAIKNTPEMHPVQNLSFMEALDGIFHSSDADDVPDCFRVITNKDKVYGASVLLYPGVVDELYREYGKRYVIPSSIHEVLLVDGSVDPAEYLKMVKDVNTTVVQAEDILSNTIYQITEDGLSIALEVA